MDRSPFSQFPEARMVSGVQTIDAGVYPSLPLSNTPGIGTTAPPLMNATQQEHRPGRHGRRGRSSLQLPSITTGEVVSTVAFEPVIATVVVAVPSDVENAEQLSIVSDGSDDAAAAHRQRPHLEQRSVQQQRHRRRDPAGDDVDPSTRPSMGPPWCSLDTETLRHRSFERMGPRPAQLPTRVRLSQNDRAVVGEDAAVAEYTVGIDPWHPILALLVSLPFVLIYAALFVVAPLLVGVIVMSTVGVLHMMIFALCLYRCKWTKVQIDEYSLRFKILERPLLAFSCDDTFNSGCVTELLNVRKYGGGFFSFLHGRARVEVLVKDGEAGGDNDAWFAVDRNVNEYDRWVDYVNYLKEPSQRRQRRQ